jgi:hypothetical protein
MGASGRRRCGQYVGALALALGLLGGCGGGGGGQSGSTPPPPVANAAPQAAVSLSGPVTAGAGGGDVSTFTNSVVSFDAGASKDPDGDALSYRWSVVSRPQGSNAALSAATAQSSLQTDAVGTYVVNVRVTDSRGASTDKQVTLIVNSNPPVTSLSLLVSYGEAPTVNATRSVAASAVIVLDASGSKDVDGDLVTTSWELVERPASSRTSLTVAGSTARFVADVVGLYKVRARGTDPSGAYSEVIYPIEAVGNVPQTVITSSVINYYKSSGSNAITTSLGNMVAFSGTNSRDPDGDSLTYRWVLQSKPPGSTAQISKESGEFTQLTPDVMGSYTVSLLATDPSGGASSYETNVYVNNRTPVAAINTNSAPLALPTGPTVRLPVGTSLSLRGSASVDADGDALTYAWTLSGKPATSAAVLSGATTTTAQLTTDVAGSYQVRLRVTDTAGAYSEKLLNIDSGNTSPTAVLDKSRVSVLAGNPVVASAALSFDDDGDALTYSWALDARPPGSSAMLAAPTTARLAFTPDVAGTYTASVTVSDGKNASVSYVTIRALGSTTSNVALNFVPLEMRYSKGIDRFVAYATNPNALHIVDPFTGLQRQVPLPLGVRSLNLSGNGKLAAVLHDGVVSLVDLETATLIRSTPTGGSSGEAFVTDNGLIYVMGVQGGWNDQVATIFDGRTGADLTGIRTFYGQGTFYGSQRGIFAHTKNRGFVMSSGLSPGDVSYFEIDRTSGAVTRASDSPYHGDYVMGAPFFLSGNEDLLFMPSGVYFRTDTLQFAGQLPLNNILSMSHSATADEAIILTATSTPDGGYSYTSTLTYLPSYRRYVGGLFLREADIQLPVIDGKQSYGINIFHSANDNHITLVQTGSALKNQNGNLYYLVTR